MEAFPEDLQVLKLCLKASLCRNEKKKLKNEWAHAFKIFFFKEDNLNRSQKRDNPLTFPTISAMLEDSLSAALSTCTSAGT